MKRYPKSNAEQPISIERISGVEMAAPLGLMPGERRLLTLEVMRLEHDSEVIVWTSAKAVEVEP